MISQNIVSSNADNNSTAWRPALCGPLLRSVWIGTFRQNTVHGMIPNHAKEMHKMAKTSNKLVNPNAREAMDRFKMEAANEVGVNLKQGYNGDLTSKQAGSVGGQMVRKMIQAYENGMQ